MYDHNNGNALTAQRLYAEKFPKLFKNLHQLFYESNSFETYYRDEFHGKSKFIDAHYGESHFKHSRRKSRNQYKKNI